MLSCESWMLMKENTDRKKKRVVLLYTIMVSYYLIRFSVQIASAVKLKYSSLQINLWFQFSVSGIMH